MDLPVQIILRQVKIKLMKLVDEISASNEITPLIVAIDKDSPLYFRGRDKSRSPL